VAVLRGRLGSFERNTLQTNINSLSVSIENLTAAESAIRDTDFAAETSRLTRNQILVSAGTSVLALANSTPQTVLSLLQ
jgi:flagellin